jgi:DNA-binding CsgD family transcriptional regulator
VHKTVSGRLQSIVEQTVEELLPKQEENPLELSVDDLKKLAARYGTVVRQAAGKLMTELCDAAAHRDRLTEQHLSQIRNAVRLYIKDTTSAESAKGLLASAVVRYFTVPRLNQTERVLAKLMSRAGFRKLLAKDVEEELAYLRAKFGIKCRAVRGRRVISEPLPPKQQNLSRYLDAVKLTDRQRDILSLRYEYGRSIEYIARRLGLHRKTVDEHHQRGLARLEAGAAAAFRAKVRAKTKPGNLR